MTDTEDPVAESQTIASQRKLVERIVASATFGRSERLASLLLYICEQTFQGKARELHEQHIGEVVFGRVKGSDSSIDGIVRTHASRLRQKLTAYFEGEGAAEPIRLTVPAGRYVPVFEARPTSQAAEDVPRPTAVVEEPVSVTPPPQAVAVEPKRSWMLQFAVGIALVVVGALVASLYFVHARNQSTSSGNPLWAELLKPESPTLIVPGDSSLVVWGNMMKREPDLTEYMKQSYLDANSPDPTTRLAADIGARRYTSTVDLNIVKSLSAIAQQQGGTLNVRYSRDVRPNDLKHGNVVLVGAVEANPWQRLFEPSLNFVLSLQRDSDRVVVHNRKPQGSEPAEWVLQGSTRPVKTAVFSLAAYLPNLDGQGNVLILEGDTMAGTECAWDFVNDPGFFLPFLKSIRPKGDGPIPHFEVLLSTQNTGGSASMPSVLAYRTHP